MKHTRILSCTLAASLFLPLHAREVKSPAAMQEGVKDSTRMQEVVVTGARSQTDIRHLPMTVNVIGRDVLTEKHESSLLPTLMEQVPGVFVTSRAMKGYGVSTGSSGNISMRGLTGGTGQMLVLIDGHPQYNGIYSHPISDSYQTMMAERVEVLRGPASMLYGSSAMGGVINIVTRRMEEDGVKTDIGLSGGSYGTLEAEATNRVRKGRFGSTASFLYGRSDNHRPHMGFEQYSAYLKATYDISSHWDACLDANLTHFDAQYPGSTQEPVYGAEQWITRGVVSAALQNHYGSTQGAVSVFSNFGRHKIDDGTKKIGTSTDRFFRSKDALTGVSFYQSAQLWQGGRFTLGLDYQHIYGNAYYTSKATGEVLDTPNKQSGRSHRDEVAAYADLRQDITSWLTADAGIRFDHHSITGGEWVPQAGIVLRPIETGEVKLMASKGYRNPTMRELYLYPPSNEELEPECIWNYELSWRHRTPHLHYGVNLFYLKGDNMIQTINRKNVNTGEVENCGIEAELTYRFNSHWTATTNHAWLHTKHDIVAAPAYKGYLGVTFRQGRFHATASAQYLHDLCTQAGDNPTSESFCLVDLTGSYTLAKYVTLWARGENLLAQRYEINLGYPMPRATVMAGVKVSF